MNFRISSLIDPCLSVRMSERKVEIPISREIRTRLKELKGVDSYNEYLDKLTRAGSKQ